MRKLLFLVLLLSSFFGRAQYTAIPDVNFEKSLIGDGVDSGVPDGQVLTSKISVVTTLDVSYRTITDLTGIQDFSSLTSLRCNHNQLKFLNLNNPLLQTLICNNNQLTNLNISKCLNLKTLWCFSNQLISLDINKNTALETLYCNDNKLTDLDFFNNKLLSAIGCSNNQLISLDVSNNKALSSLDLSINKLTSLDITKNNNLFFLYCYENQLNSLNLKNGNNSKLTIVNFTKNPSLSCIQVDNKAYSDTNWSIWKDATVSYSENCGATTAIKPPVITATGNQTYCPQTKIKIATSVTIQHDPAQPTTDAVYIQISSGYSFGEEVLSLSGSYPNIVPNWIASEGKLILSNPSGGQVPYSDFETAIENVEFYNSSPSASGTRNFSINLGIGQANFLPRNKHFYEYIPALGITWTDASVAAAAKTYYGLQGYLATLTAADEATLAGKQAQGAGWIGGSDAANEGIWKWVTGPEGLANGGNGIIFWNGIGNGSTPNFAYWNTPNNEPNNLGNEDYAHIKANAVPGIPGSWNDLSNTGGTSGDYQPKGYIVEYGEMIPGDVDTIQISTSTSITLPNITSTTPRSICGSGSLTLQATATDGIVNWYVNSTGGTPIATGNSFTTPILTTSKSYYVDASNGSCSLRTEIIATINPIPSVTSTSPNFRCDIGTVTLSAVASSGTINWYETISGGTALGTGISFTTPNITATTTYYVEASSSGCTSLTRTPILATINNSPMITSTTPNSRCDSGTVTLEAVASAGTINWYDAPSGGTLLGTGTSFTTPNITITTPYYVEATAAGCTTLTRTSILATVNSTPSITSMTPNSRCDSGTVTLGAVVSAGTINWYDTTSGGTLLGTGTSFTTPNISASTTYYIEATAAGCTTLTRTTILATVNSTPSITSTTPNSRCDSGTVTLGAVASAGTINWYDTISGGTLLGTGTSFTTPNITITTPYYIEAATAGCSSPRLLVLATVFPVQKLTEEVVLCQNTTATLDASNPGMKYLWSPGGEISQTISVSSIGDYSVLISSPLANCDSKKDIKVIQYPKPIIKEIMVAENSITIQLENPQNYYEYAIDGRFFQDSNQFSYIPSGQHTAIVRDKKMCNLVPQDFTIFTIAKYFTPNNDGYNDVWEIKEMKNFPNSSASVFDRYGKLITTLTASKYWWDGKYLNNLLPADDYWYRLKLDEYKPEIKGNFSLKR